MTMKRLATALTAAGLFALAGCGGGSSSNNAASIDNTADFFNVTADDLGGNDMGAATGNVSGSNASNGSRTGNGASGHPTNASGGSHASRPTRNTH